MDRSQEADLFEQMNRIPRFKEWLEGQRENEIKILGVNPNMDQLLRAQGRFGLVETMLAKLVQGSTANRR